MILANSDAGMTHAAFPAAIAERVEDWDAAAVDAAVSPVDLDGFVDALVARASAAGGSAARRRQHPSEAVADKYADWLGAGVTSSPRTRRPTAVT